MTNPVSVFSASHALLALLPIGILVWLMVARGWGASRAGPAALLLVLALGYSVFGADLQLLALSQAKGALLSIWILSIIWAALFLFHLVEETGTLPSIGAGLAHVVPNRNLQVLMLAWIFTSFLQGIAGYGVPIAVVAPIMVANGFEPAVAVITTSIGHAWSVTFGSLAASYFALAGVSGLGGWSLAVDSAVMLGLTCLLCGAASIFVFGGRGALREVAAPLLAVGTLMAVVQLGFAAVGAYSLAAFAAGAAGLVSLAAWSWLGRRARARTDGLGPQGPFPARGFVLGFAAYVALIIIVLAVTFVQPIKLALNAITLQLPFPATETTLGWVNEATDSYRTLSPFGDTGSLLLYAALAGFVIYRAAGLVTLASARRAARRTWSRAVGSSIGIATLIGFALAMTDSGMTFALASGIASVAGVYYPVVAPFIGVLGAFMTGSNTSSNILFGALQRDTAQLIGVSTTVVLAAQTAGGAIGSMLAPAKIIVGASTVGLGGNEGPILRQGMKYGAGIALVIGIAAFVWTSLP